MYQQEEIILEQECRINGFYIIDLTFTSNKIIAINRYSNKVHFLKFNQISIKEYDSDYYLYYEDQRMWQINNPNKLNNIILIKDLYDIGCLNRSMFNRFRFE